MSWPVGRFGARLPDGLAWACGPKSSRSAPLQRDYSRERAALRRALTGYSLLLRYSTVSSGSSERVVFPTRTKNSLPFGVFAKTPSRV